MKYLTPRILIVVAVQTLALVFMIGMKQWTLNTGTPIVLETEPIDPRSLFRGDYVRLRYSISELRVNALAGEDDFIKHDRVYVVLEKGETYWRPVSLHSQAPPRREGRVVIKGKVKYRFEPYGKKAEKKKAGVRLRIRYGIENYFVPEGEGMALERPAEGEVVTIRVAVDAYGNAGIQAVLVNGEPRYTESLF